MLLNLGRSLGISTEFSGRPGVVVNTKIAYYGIGLTSEPCSRSIGFQLEPYHRFCLPKVSSIIPINHRNKRLISVITLGIMPVAPITGRLRRRIWTDLGTALGLGVSSAYAYWYVLSPSILSFLILSQFRYFYYIPTGESTVLHRTWIVDSVIIQSKSCIFTVHVALKAEERLGPDVESRTRTARQF